MASASVFNTSHTINLSTLLDVRCSITPDCVFAGCYSFVLHSNDFGSIFAMLMRRSPVGITGANWRLLRYFRSPRLSLLADRDGIAPWEQSGGSGDASFGRTYSSRMSCYRSDERTQLPGKARKAACDRVRASVESLISVVDSILLCCVGLTILRLSTVLTTSAINEHARR